MTLSEERIRAGGATGGPAAETVGTADTAEKIGIAGTAREAVATDTGGVTDDVGAGGATGALGADQGTGSVTADPPAAGSVSTAVDTDSSDTADSPAVTATAVTAAAGPGHPTGPLVRRNDYGVLVPPVLGRWEPVLRVSVVVPAFGGQRGLDLVLASLAAQSYPASLLDVVVVDDASVEPLRLPVLCPESTRLVRVSGRGWGPGRAFAAGVGVAGGDVVLRLDADVVAGHRHVESHMRWHHRSGLAVVTGRAVPAQAPPGLSVQEVHRRVRETDLDGLPADGRVHASRADRLIGHTHTLRAAGHRAWEACTGTSFSVRRAWIEQAGGVDASIPGDEVRELAHRLTQRGAVVVPERESLLLRLEHPDTRDGRPGGQGGHLGEGAEHLGGAARPFLENRVPREPSRRAAPCRSWQVPFADVVVETVGETYDTVVAKVDLLLAERPRDIRVTLVGPWARVTPGRHRGVDDPEADLRLLHEHYRCEPRVRYSARVPEEDPDVPFVLSVPAGIAPRAGVVATMTEKADARHAGLVRVRGGGPTLVRTAALARARRLFASAPGEPDGLNGPDRFDKEAGVREVWGECLLEPDSVLPGPNTPPADWHKQMRRAERERDEAREEAARWERRVRAVTGGRWNRLLLGRSRQR